MTDGDQRAAGKLRGRIALGGTSLQLGIAVLTGLLVLAFVVVLGLRIVHPESLNSGRAAATRAGQRDDDIVAAARKATVAFLDVDYRDLKPRMDRVIALSTGTFKKEYKDSAVNFTTAARQGHAVSHGEVVRIGIADVDDDSAVVFVAANQTVSNLAIEKARQTNPNVDDKRYYRFQFNMTRVGGRWLLAGLQVVV